MSSVRASISISLDGFVAGPNQSLENPIGEGGMRLHEWVIGTESWRRHHGLEGGEPGVDSDIVDEVAGNIGAVVMGRKMFGGGDGSWDSSWKGWWGDDPPFHVPVFVLTHHEREPLPMDGGTTFSFVTEGVTAAVARARDAAGDRDVSIAGGASAIQQVLAAGLLDDLWLHVAPIVLGAGERLLENIGDPRLVPTAAIASPGVTHLRYRVER
ncbi:MAG TPA: dihydrofolate reductase family protein [Solirubrobacteraceae bacterium]|nr:dihydrofolate reductase family protein [Solirubrobacteraceae bacterium]